MVNRKLGLGRARTYWNKKPAKLWRIFALVVVAGLLLARYGVSVIIQNYNSQTTTTRFNSAIQNYTSQLGNHFEIYANTLYSARALWLTSPAVSRQDWFTFVDAQNIKQRYPAVYALSYAQVINRGQIDDLTRQLNDNRLPDENNKISIYPANPKDQLVVVTYIAPRNISQKNIGYDLLSSPVRSQDLYAARDSGLPQASAPLLLLSDPQNSPPSLLIAMPIYKSSSSLATVAERRSALTGFAILGLHTKPMMDAVFKAPDGYSPIAVTVKAGQQVIYKTGSTPAGQAMRKTVTINVAGQYWLLDFRAPNDYGLNSTATLTPVILRWSIVPFGLVLLILLYFLINLQAFREQSLKGKNN